jgi:hypothetical protein
MNDRLKDPGFRNLYERECHVCKTTIAVISRFEKDPHLLSDALKTLKISWDTYDALKKADMCRPEVVRQLCIFLGMTVDGLFEKCPNRGDFV